MAGEVCPDCKRPRKLQVNGGCVIRGGDACVRTERDNLRTQLKAAETGLHLAWEEGYAVGVDAGGGIGYAREGFSTDNPYPEVNHADD